MTFIYLSVLLLVPAFPFARAIPRTVDLSIVQFMNTTTAVTSSSSTLLQQHDDHHDHHHQQQRQQQQAPPGGIFDFVPLTCNTNLPSVTCSTWTSIFGTIVTSYTNRVVIPCGQCIVLDLPSPRLELLGGIDIIGKLIIPDGYSIEIIASIIAVQGELEMTATKPVDGIPNIRFVMVGNDGGTTTTFTPIDNNANACRGVATCNAGKKAIVVAGGKVNIHGLPENTISWTRLYDVVGSSNNPTTILVPNSVIGKWAVGAELLITPHTIVWNATQVRTIKSVQTVGDYAALELNASITRPTTIIESSDFAVEVALLSRNIVFDSGPDPINQHGGHFMIMNTPNVIQTIEGVEIKNFGQQGTLGRYPIHFHFCSNVAGSLVSKNTIRQSFQRCVVVHGTNKLNIEDNVAFDTRGHCYMTEDGIEIENVFFRNLGSRTGVPTTKIPNVGSNGNETDAEPATFWISSPTNSFIENVAAGSQHSGYWFEPRLRGERAILYPRVDPKRNPLIVFRDNVAHSNTGLTLGAVRMYQPGYFPTVMTPLTRLKVYRNNGKGIYIHRCQNIRVDQGLFADNSIGIDLDRMEGIEVTNTTVIGKSPSYDVLMQRQTVAAICDRSERIGIDLHTWQVEIDYWGAKISNVTMSGFAPIDARCARPRSIRFDSFNLKQGLFECYTAMEKVQLADGLNSINMCVVNDAFHDFVYLIDLDGSFRPDLLISPTVSTLVASDNRKHMTFVDTTKCSHNTVGCYSYCSDTCFRSMRYYVDGIGQENYTLNVCSTTNATLCTTFKGGRRSTTGSHEYVAHLPTGQRYNAIFMNEFGININPTMVRSVVEKHFCPQHEFLVTLQVATPVGASTKAPTKRPTATPTKRPTAAPTKRPTKTPTQTPTSTPTTLAPSKEPTIIPSLSPTNSPSESPTIVPSVVPTKVPTNRPTLVPTLTPTEEPSTVPSESPTDPPSDTPTTSPSNVPTKSPTQKPTKTPTVVPSVSPTDAPSVTPTTAPSVSLPSKVPTETPTIEPTKVPTARPSNFPTDAPSGVPTKAPTPLPTQSPTDAPTKQPTFRPTKIPTKIPTKAPTKRPVSVPTPATIAWINEIHYDNIGRDVNEFIEIAHIGSIINYTVVLYNGNIRKLYATQTITNISNSSAPINGTQYTVVTFPTINIQDGGTTSAPASDGMALVDLSSRVVEFLSYEGTFVALNGRANGMQSIDIGVAESTTTTPVNFSLQRITTPTSSTNTTSGMRWVGPILNTMGRPNTIP